jgi:hypothetical protein
METLRQALRGLPDPTPPAQLWRDVEARLTKPRAHWVGWGVAATIGLLSFWLIFGEFTPRTEHPDFAGLISESRSLERLVANQPVSFGPIRKVLLQRVSDIDAELNDTLLRDANEARAVRLLERRVALLRALADLGNRAPENFNRAVRPAVYTGDRP